MSLRNHALSFTPELPFPVVSLLSNLIKKDTKDSKLCLKNKDSRKKVFLQQKNRT